MGLDYFQDERDHAEEAAVAADAKREQDAERIAEILRGRGRTDEEIADLLRKSGL